MIKRIFLVMFFLVSSSAYATVLSGNLNSIPESQGRFYWGDGINSLYQEWSIAYSNYSGWFYTSEYVWASNADIYVYKGLTDVTLVNDASSFLYQTTGAIQAAEGDTVFFRGKNGFYGAWKIDSIDGFTGFGNFPYGYLSGSWYFVENGKSDFSNVEVSEPPSLYLIIVMLPLLLLIRKYVTSRCSISRFAPWTVFKSWFCCAKVFHKAAT